MKNVKKIFIHPRYEPCEGKTSILFHQNTEICIVKINGKLKGINNLCPHKLAPISDGKIENGEIICPLHQFRFDLNTGQCNIKGFDTVVYDIEVQI